jgi:hypothetical protein
MKITKSRLKEIVKEELEKLLAEHDVEPTDSKVHEHTIRGIDETRGYQK